jgi:hypothetical protein
VTRHVVNHKDQAFVHNMKVGDPLLMKNLSMYGTSKKEQDEVPEKVREV